MNRGSVQDRIRQDRVRQGRARQERARQDRTGQVMAAPGRSLQGVQRCLCAVLSSNDHSACTLYLVYLGSTKRQQVATGSA